MTFLIYGATKGKGSGIGRSVALLLQGKGHKVHGLCRDEAKARARECAAAVKITLTKQ